jgi:hypothetical protein
MAWLRGIGALQDPFLLVKTLEVFVGDTGRRHYAKDQISIIGKLLILGSVLKV